MGFTVDILWYSPLCPKRHGARYSQRDSCSVGESTMCMGAHIVMRGHRGQKYNDAFQECHEREHCCCAHPLPCWLLRWYIWLKYCDDAYQFATPHVSSCRSYPKKYPNYYLSPSKAIHALFLYILFTFSSASGRKTTRPQPGIHRKLPMDAALLKPTLWHVPGSRPTRLPLDSPLHKTWIPMVL